MWRDRKIWSGHCTLPSVTAAPNCQPREIPKMCGICGTVAFSSLTSPEAAHLRVTAMLQSLSHRGPDATSQVAIESAVLGATRLAIRGLNDQPNQPITDAESGVITVCNGEIDNHRELSRWLEERGRPVQQETAVAAGSAALYMTLGALAPRRLGARAHPRGAARHR